MSNYKVYEGSSVDDELENNSNIKIGDTIEYISNNQEGYEKYEVVLKNGKKDLQLIATYDDMELSDMEGGKKRTNKKQTNKKRTNKTRTNKKRTNKKRTNKKRTNKKRTNKKRTNKKRGKY